jgi:Fe-S-cluster containining protein
VTPWTTLLVQAAKGDCVARAFLNQYQPYPSLQEAITQAPDAVAASQEVAKQRGDDAEALVFYRCIYLQGKNQCQIYEDRPALCREFPESPFGAIPKCCGYYPLKQDCQRKIQTLREELAELKRLQSMLE